VSNPNHAQSLKSIARLRDSGTLEPKGNEERLALGSYPEVSLTTARRDRDKARDVLKGGNDRHAPHVLDSAIAGKAPQSIGLGPCSASNFLPG
jgi:hypothetical protein